mmetsp:Transcript_29427/g.90192  ORF Transcript_29427/g.90192 Transcript_29427/m.90192 type:complete len:278 (-) Transcript_29427:224-1057(-)
MVGGHQHTGIRVLAEVRERVTQNKCIGINGEAVDACLGKLKDKVHLVQAELAEIVRTPAIILGCEARAHEEGRNVAFLQPAACLVIECTNQVVRLIKCNEMLHKREGKVKPVEVDVGGDEHIVGGRVLLRQLGRQSRLVGRRLYGRQYSLGCRIRWRLGAPKPARHLDLHSTPPAGIRHDTRWSHRERLLTGVSGDRRKRGGAATARRRDKHGSSGRRGGDNDCCRILLGALCREQAASDWRVEDGCTAHLLANSHSCLLSRYHPLGAPRSSLVLGA